MTNAPVKVPNLQLARVLLRPWKDTDGCVVDAADKVSNTFNYMGVPQPGQFGDWLAARREDQQVGRRVSWCIQAPDGQPAGAMNIKQLHTPGRPEWASIGYWLRPAYRGHKYALEAIVGAVEHATAPVCDGGLGRRVIEARVVPSNHASIRALETAGFVHVGVDPQVYTDGYGVRHDDLLYEFVCP